MCDGYQSVGRNITEFYFGYDLCQMFVFCNGPVRLFILAEPSAEPDKLGGAARAFMKENAPALSQLPPSTLTQRIKVPTPSPEVTAPSKEEVPVEEVSDSETVLPVPVPAEPVPMAPDEWVEFRESLHQLISRVMGSVQSSRMIDRVAKEHGYGKQSPPKDVFDGIANAVVDKIPNRSKRRDLKSLIDELVRSVG